MLIQPDRTYHRLIAAHSPLLKQGKQSEAEGDVVRTAFTIKRKAAAQVDLYDQVFEYFVLFLGKVSGNMIFDDIVT